VIYLDTSALIKLYLIEKGSETVNDLVLAQDEPLPMWELQEAELVNALRLKVFWGEMSEVESDKLIADFQRRKQSGLYFYPDLDRIQILPYFHKLSMYTQKLGCRTLDILHVSCALIIQADRFVSFDVKQCALAELAGLEVVGPESGN